MAANVEQHWGINTFCNEVFHILREKFILEYNYSKPSCRLGHGQINVPFAVSTFRKKDCRRSCASSLRFAVSERHFSVSANNINHQPNKLE